jgi:uncharacterized peroxidase-related enzyme
MASCLGRAGYRAPTASLARSLASRINGCAYCASVHALRFTQLTKEPEVMQRIQRNGAEAALDPRRRAILDYAAKLTRDPGFNRSRRRSAAACARADRPRDP